MILTRRQRRLPGPGTSERVFLAELEAAGIPTGPFNLPDWEESIVGLQRLLDSLFGKTPPTAIFIDESLFFAPTQQYLSRKGFRVPEDVSLICADGDPTFQWCQPSIAHIHWDHRPMLRRTVSWVGEVQRGKNNRKQFPVKAEFLEGDSVGPVHASP